MKDIYTIFPFFCLHCSFLSISHQAFQIAEEFLIRKKKQKNIYFVVFDRDWRICAVSMACFFIKDAEESLRTQGPGSGVGLTLFNKLFMVKKYTG